MVGSSLIRSRRRLGFEIDNWRPVLVPFPSSIETEQDLFRIPSGVPRKQRKSMALTSASWWKARRDRARAGLMPIRVDEMCPAGRSSPKTYQTRRAGASFVRATDVARHGTATWTWLHSSRETTALEFRRNRMHILSPSTGGTEAVVRVTVRRGVPVTVRRADVRRLIVERPAPKQTRVWSPPAGRSFYEKCRFSGDRCRHAGHDRSSS